MLSKFSANQNQRKFNDAAPAKDHYKMQAISKELNLNSQFILDMMRENDTLTVKRSVPPRAYFDILLRHQQETSCRVVRVEALASAIPNMIRFCELAQVCDLATITKIQTKPRRMKVGQDSDLTL